MISRWLSTVSLTVVLTGLASAFAGEVPPPANAAAKFRWDAGRGELTVEYHGGTILTASVAAKDAAGKYTAVVFRPGDKIVSEIVRSIPTGSCRNSMVACSTRGLTR